MPRPLRKMIIPKGTCEASGKLKFTRSDAQSALDRARNDPRTYRRECRIYECPSCHSWHLTSKATYEAK